MQGRAPGHPGRIQATPPRLAGAKSAYLGLIRSGLEVLTKRGTFSAGRDNDQDPHARGLSLVRISLKTQEPHIVVRKLLGGSPSWHHGITATGRVEQIRSLVPSFPTPVGRSLRTLQGTWPLRG